VIRVKLDSNFLLAHSSFIGRKLSLSHYSQIIADAHVQQLTGNPGIGLYQIRFSVELSMPAWADDNPHGVYLSDLRSRVLVGANGGSLSLLGMAYPEAALVLRPTRYSNRTYLLFDLDLSPQQMFELESKRGGGDLNFQLQILAQTFGPNGALAVREDAPKTVTVSDWRKVLGELGYADIMVLGFEIPKGKGGIAAADAAKCLRQAQEDLLRGQYDAVVAKCRLAIEGLHTAFDEGKESIAAAVKFASSKDRKSMTKLERSLFIGEAVRHFSHLAHHPGSDGTQEAFCRSEALAILAFYCRLR
jgi:hypothetical protein